MLCIQHHSTDPYFNLAVDEYIFKHKDEDCFMLWRNDNAIIVGKHQNTLAEINLDYVQDKGIKVVRRMSGGGAVYHDLGNLNFTFTKTGEQAGQVDFHLYTQPIIDVLKELGVNAEFQGRNDLVIDGKKFSGNAEYIFKNKVLHHGTILFSSHMPDISGALKANPLKFKDKAVKSIPKRVTNVMTHLAEPISLDAFTDRVMAHIINTHDNCQPYTLSEADIAAINQIRDEKYATWEWNYGLSPQYNFQQGIRTKGGTLEMHLDVHQGVIKQCRIFGDFFTTGDISEIESVLIGQRHDKTAIRACLKPFNIEDYFHHMTLEDLLTAMF
ncbi:MAG: lipoate--protein ligase family protein [Proteobacteria bacterium]|nr:MAG: lipoate--protein ligase family protein [Pseudomonadota bacterium]